MVKKMLFILVSVICFIGCNKKDFAKGQEKSEEQQQEEEQGEITDKDITYGEFTGADGKKRTLAVLFGGRTTKAAGKEIGKTKWESGDVLYLYLVSEDAKKFVTISFTEKKNDSTFWKLTEGESLDPDNDGTTYGFNMAYYAPGYKIENSTLAPKSDADAIRNEYIRASATSTQSYKKEECAVTWNEENHEGKDTLFVNFLTSKVERAPRIRFYYDEIKQGVFTKVAGASLNVKVKGIALPHAPNNFILGFVDLGAMVTSDSGNIFLTGYWQDNKSGKVGTEPWIWSTGDTVLHKAFQYITGNEPKANFILPINITKGISKPVVLYPYDGQTWPEDYSSFDGQKNEDNYFCYWATRNIGQSSVFSSDAGDYFSAGEKKAGEATNGNYDSTYSTWAENKFWKSKVEHDGNVFYITGPDIATQNWTKRYGDSDGYNKDWVTPTWADFQHLKLACTRIYELRKDTIVYYQIMGQKDTKYENNFIIVPASNLIKWDADKKKAVMPDSTKKNAFFRVNAFEENNITELESVLSAHLYDVKIKNSGMEDSRSALFDGIPVRPTMRILPENAEKKKDELDLSSYEGN